MQCNTENGPYDDNILELQKHQNAGQLSESQENLLPGNENILSTAATADIAMTTVLDQLFTTPAPMT